ncbi:ATP/GTP-binding protein [uncultured Thiodictyon sp.]|uniref:AAA family ATPase n=1 Tax=uncultured Thiodictyon sp. TaxID=1846217 RepID=UPI0025DFA8A7|nr:ATP-binding protein [uncultured Thiodictyon sp.]
MSKLTQIELTNFTAFESLNERFSPGVNVMIGVNGTGKTHLLKILYAACAVTSGEDKETGFAHKLLGVFKPYEGRIARLIRRRQGLTAASVAVRRDDQREIKVSFGNRSGDVNEVHVEGELDWQATGWEAAYIPVKEMLAQAPGFLSTVAKREIAFEEVYPDIIKRAYLPKLRGTPDEGRARMLTVLQTIMEGKVILKGETFFLKNSHGELEFMLLAEGSRKLALLWLLIQNGTLLSGSVLFWDEPEANLNPSLIGEVVEIILGLQRLGVQVFLTTHNYVLLKEFDLRKNSRDALRYISLFRDESGAVAANASEGYSAIEPNAILGTFSDLYDRQLTRSLGGLKA